MMYKNELINNKYQLLT